MNCFFCQSPLRRARKENGQCHNCPGIIYHETDEQNKIKLVNFIETYNNQLYEIEINARQNTTTIRHYDPDQGVKIVLQVPGIAITPQNVKAKLPIYLLFL